jgi:PAS domain-containing protein
MQGTSEITLKVHRAQVMHKMQAVGIVMFNLEGAIIGANEAFLRMVQYNREDLASGRVRWMRSFIG